MKEFYKRFAMARKSRGMTQNDIAECLDVSFQAVSLWERGETMPELDKIPDIADLLQVSMEWLLLGKSDKKPECSFVEPLSERIFSEDKMYTYIKTTASYKKMEQTLRVLPYVRELHSGQVRKGKEKVPYMNHPLLVTCHALALGIDDDNLIAAALLHDVCEDCNITASELPVNKTTQEAVWRVTKDKTKDINEYYETIAENEIATIVKLLDRCNNISGMAAGFSREKMIEYMNETEQYIYPLMDKANVRYPQYADIIFLIKYHMKSVINSLKHLLILQ